MCLAVPGKIIEKRDERGTTMGTIDFDGVRKEICLAFLPDIAIGDYAIVHAGFAVSRLDEASAQETLRMMAELGVLEDELGQPLPITGGVTDNVTNDATDNLTDMASERVARGMS